MKLIPYPKKICCHDGMFMLTPETLININANCSFDELETARVLQKHFKSRLGFQPFISKSFDSCIKDAVSLVKTSEGNEEYTMEISDDRISISSGGSAGLFYGVQTLCQLINEYGPELPCLMIDDGPDFRNRGFLHDVTRGKVPTLSTLKELADRASFYKLNQLQLNIEHTFAFRGMSEVWRGSDPLTAEEIMEFDKYCRERHIELVPALQVFGHMYHLLSSKSFSEFCELDYNKTRGTFVWPERMEHHTIDVSNPESIGLVKKMLDQYIPLFSSDKFNINGDETFDIGMGKSREAAEKVGKHRIYFDFLMKIISLVQGYGKQVMFWNDVILESPEYLSDLPRDIICLNWDYGAEERENKIKAIAQTGLEQYVCPGVDGWNKIVSDHEKVCANISWMIKFGIKYGASGILNTDWGDYGHINLLANSIPGMIFGANLGWNADQACLLADTYKRMSLQEYGDSTEKLGELLIQLGKIDISWTFFSIWSYNRAYHKTNTDPLERWHANMSAEYINRFDEATIWKDYLKASNIEKSLITMSKSILPQRKTDMEEFILSARAVMLFTSIKLIIKKYDQTFKVNIDKLIHTPFELAEQFELWFSRYEKLWRLRNKESELYRIRDCIFDICDVLRTYDK